MVKKYLITQEQLDLINHYKRMFELNADLIQDLCKSKRDSVVYGFELGKMHTHLKSCFVEMMELESEIRSQEFDVDDKDEATKTQYYDCDFINDVQEKINITKQFI